MGHVDLQNGIWIICTKCLIYCTQDHDFVGLLYVSDVWAVEHLAILKVVDENMPQIHVSSNTRAIIDCTEIKCQMSSSLLYAGSISGWLITWRSRFLDLFEANDSIMVDKGFNIQNLLPGVVPLKIPPIFTQFRSDAHCGCRKNTRNCIYQNLHGESNKQSEELWHLGQYVTSQCIWHCLWVNQMWTVCIHLCNVQDPVVS